MTVEKYQNPDLEGAGGSYTGGDGISITDSDIDIDLTDTAIFTTSGAASRVPVLDIGSMITAEGISGTDVYINANDNLTMHGFTATTITANDQTELIEMSAVGTNISGVAVGLSAAGDSATIDLNSDDGGTASIAADFGINIISGSELSLAAPSLNIGNSGSGVAIAGNSLALGHYARTSDIAPGDLTISAQNPWASATGANRKPGDIVLNLGTPTNGGTTHGKVSVLSGGAERLSVQYDGTSTNVAAGNALVVGTASRATTATGSTLALTSAAISIGTTAGNNTTIGNSTGDVTVSSDNMHTQIASGGLAKWSIGGVDRIETYEDATVSGIRIGKNSAGTHTPLIGSLLSSTDEIYLWSGTQGITPTNTNYIFRGTPSSFILKCNSNAKITCTNSITNIENTTMNINSTGVMTFTSNSGILSDSSSYNHVVASNSSIASLNAGTNEFRSALRVNHFTDITATEQRLSILYPIDVSLSTNSATTIATVAVPTARPIFVRGSIRIWDASMNVYVSNFSFAAKNIAGTVTIINYVEDNTVSGLGTCVTTAINSGANALIRATRPSGVSCTASVTYWIEQ